MKRGMDMIRAFLALEIPEDSKDWIEQRRQEMARVAKGAVRWVKREGLHVTLHFFGQIPTESVEKIGDIVGPVAAEVSPFELRVKGVGAFPSLRAPRVLWTGVEEEGETKPLKRLHASLEQALAQAGFPVEKRPFSAHITMGRVRKSLRMAWEGFQNLPPGPHFKVNELVLFQSILAPDGARYQPLKHFPLEGV